MRRMKAFLIAVVLSIVTIIGIHYYGVSHIEFNPHEIGVWTDDAKFLSREGIVRNQDENTMVIFGSSEFEQGKYSDYHITNFFKEDEFVPMLLGRNQSQSLQNAVTLSSIGNDLKNKKIVCILSPQWFQRKGIANESYAFRFSENNYVGMLQNDKISDELKEKMINRTTSLLKGADEPMLERVELYNRIFFTKDATLKDKVTYRLYDTFNQEKDRLRVIEKATYRGIGREADGPYKEGSYDWDALYAAADMESQQLSDNPLYMEQGFYEKNEKLIKKKKGSDKGRKFRKKSKEFKDLAIFLDVCKELDIEALVIVAPNNGYWLSNTEYPQKVRDKTYAKIIKVAEKHGAQVCDLSGEEFTPYFFMDNFHFSGKGWVKINEAIYKFYKQDEGQSQS